MRAALRECRVKAGLTQAELAARIGITQQTLSKHETGIRSPAHFRIIRGYERELGQPARALFPDIFID